MADFFSSVAGADGLDGALLHAVRPSPATVAANPAAMLKKFLLVKRFELTRGSIGYPFIHLLILNRRLIHVINADTVSSS